MNIKKNPKSITAGSYEIRRKHFLEKACDNLSLDTKDYDEDTIDFMLVKRAIGKKDNSLCFITENKSWYQSFEALEKEVNSIKNSFDKEENERKAREQRESLDQLKIYNDTLENF